MKEEKNNNQQKIIGSLLKDQLNNISESRKNYKNGINQKAIITGFKELDKLTGGWKKSEFIIIGARPGMGKDSLALSLARNALDNSINKVAYFSLEMNTNQITNRLISMETEISMKKIKSGLLLNSEWKYLVNNLNRLMLLPLYIDNSISIDIFELIEKIKILKEEKNINLFFIDSLQSISFGKNQNVTQVSKLLKELTRELDITIIATSQLNRQVENRGGEKRPIMSDLKGSDNLEEDADIIILLYRPEYYRITQDEDGLDCRGMAELNIAKNRDGNTDTIKVQYKNQFGLLCDYEEFDFNANFSDDDKPF